MITFYSKIFVTFLSLMSVVYVLKQDDNITDYIPFLEILFY